jgi:hypothetical protein
MRVMGRFWLAGLLACLVAAFSASAAWAAEFGVVPGSFISGACDNASPAEGCTEPATQAGEHPKFSISTFRFNTDEKGVPAGPPKRVRLDSPPGFVTNPHAVPTCTSAELGTVAGAEKCPLGSQIGSDVIVIYNPLTEKDELAPGEPASGFPVYNMEPPLGAPSDFAFLTPTGRVDLVGGVSWHTEAVNSGVPTGDSHEFYVIDNISAFPAPLVSSTLVLVSKPFSAFLTLPTSCTGPPTTYLEVESYAGEVKSATFNPSPLQTLECATVPFSPAFSLTPETTQSDLPDGIETTLEVPQNQNPTERASSHVRTVEVTLPEGMTLNPSAAHGIEACTPEQVEITPTKPTNECPAGSKIGTVTLETPAVLAPRGLPAEHEGVLTGNIYLARPASGLITGPPYTIYLFAETAADAEHHVGGEYGVGLIQKGTVTPNAATGQLTTTFAENAQSPFSHLTLHFNGGALAPLANPLVCGSAVAIVSVAPWSGNPASVFKPLFAVDSNGKGGPCASPLPFSLAQSTEDNPSTGASNTNFTLNLARADGQQYLSKVSATLPEGLVGKIPAVPLCGESQANLGTCSAASQIGTASVKVGSGPTPTEFSGPVFLTGPYAGAPYGMSIAVNVAAGPFSLGVDVTRAKIEVDEFTGRVTVASQLPTIFKGIPLRLRSLSVAINRQGFLINPTNCGTLSTDTLLTSTFGSTQSISTPFQASGCSALPFKPRLHAKTNAKASRRNGVSFETSIGYPLGHQANIKSVKVQLPKQLPSRLSTLKLACAEATFKANPNACPSGSNVGTVSTTTPVLPLPLTGHAYFVSHGGAAFPDLDLVMSGNGVTIILVGNTNISKGITTTTFASVPDVPVSSFHLKLPAGKFSALAGRGNLCRSPLVMPTTITGQNGAVLKQRIRISVAGCGVQVLSHRVRDHRVILKIKAFSAGRLTVGGHDLRTVHRRLRKAGTIKVSVPLSRAGLSALANAHRHHHHLKLRVRARFVPRKGHASVASVRVVFR